MHSSTVNICVLTLVLLSFQQICHSRPQRVKRGLVKDYFVPDTLIFESDKFEKGEDGKFYLKKSAHKRGSEVNYIPADNAERKNDVVPDVSKVEPIKDGSKETESLNVRTDSIKKELPEKEVELIPSSIVIKEASEKIDVKDEKAPFTPSDAKFKTPEKPDAKDEVVFKTDLPAVESEEKVDEKISIGQVPDLSSRLVPMPENVRIPILIPIRHISYRAMKIIPIPPADVSDRLPVPYEDDIVGEGAHESESEEVSQPLAEKERDFPIVNPLMSLLSFHNILKDLKEADKENVEKESKVVDVLGKKFLMQSNVMKYPSDDNGHTYIRFMSVKPLDDVKPAEPEHVAAEETLKKELEVEGKKDIEILKEETAAKEKEVMNEEKDKNESEMERETKEKLDKEAEILKAEETELKMKIEKNVPKEIIQKSDNKQEDKIKFIEEAVKETNMNKMPQSEVKGVDLKVDMESKEYGIKEKAESQLKAIESKDIEMKEEKMEDDDLMMMKDEEASDETVDTFMKKHVEKKMNIDSKKDLFLLEKKKKEKTMEEIEESKLKKKTEKRKKKCKCEEKDSDSDDDVDE